MISSFGNTSYGKESVKIMNWGETNSNLYVGEYCSIAENCTVLLGGNHFYNNVSSYPFGKIVDIKSGNYMYPKTIEKSTSYSNGNIIIENDVWIGANVTILSGITIGNGSIIAMNTTVVKNVPPYSIVGGNPGKIIKYRFTDEQIEKLLSIKWWTWDYSLVEEASDLLTSEDINGFIQKHYK